MGYAVVDPEVLAIAREAADALVAGAGLRLVDRPFAPTNPLQTWLTSGACDLWQDLERGMWPHRADEMTRLVRLGLDSSEKWPVPRFALPQRHPHHREHDAAALFR